MLEKKKCKCAVCGKPLGKYYISDKVAMLCGKHYTSDNIEKIYQTIPGIFVGHDHCKICGRDYPHKSLAYQCERECKRELILAQDKCERCKHDQFYEGYIMFRGIKVKYCKKCEETKIIANKFWSFIFDTFIANSWDGKVKIHIPIKEDRDKEQLKWK